MHQKVALVTGASTGIGLEVAKKLAARGAKVALVARTRTTLDDAVAAITRAGGVAEAFPLDVKDLAAVEKLPAAIVERFGRLDYIVHNAGLNHRGSIAKHSASALADIIAVNLTAPIVLTRAALPLIGRDGANVYVASLAGMVPVPGEAAYSASKAGLRAFARAAADDFAAANVHCGVVSPGPVSTGFILNDPNDVADLVFSQPMVSAEEVAAAVLRCIDERVDEIALPTRSGALATAAYLFPKIAAKIRPSLERKGRAAKEKWMRGGGSERKNGTKNGD